MYGSQTPGWASVHGRPIVSPKHRIQREVFECVEDADQVDQFDEAVEVEIVQRQLAQSLEPGERQRSVIVCWRQGGVDGVHEPDAIRERGEVVAFLQRQVSYERSDGA